MAIVDAKHKSVWIIVNPEFLSTDESKDRRCSLRTPDTIRRLELRGSSPCLKRIRYMLSPLLPFLRLWNSKLGHRRITVAELKRYPIVIFFQVVFHFGSLDHFSAGSIVIEDIVLPKHFVIFSEVFLIERPCASEVTSISSSLSGPTDPSALVSNVQNIPAGPQSYYFGNGLSQWNAYDSLNRLGGGWVCIGAPAPACSLQAYGFYATWKGSRLVWNETNSRTTMSIGSGGLSGTPTRLEYRNHFSAK